MRTLVRASATFESSLWSISTGTYLSTSLHHKPQGHSHAEHTAVCGLTPTYQWANTSLEPTGPVASLLGTHRCHQWTGTSPGPPGPWIITRQDLTLTTRRMSSSRRDKAENQLGQVPAPPSNASTVLGSITTGGHMQPSQEATPAHTDLGTRGECACPVGGNSNWCSFCRT